jgi:hypothetical protein
MDKNASPSAARLYGIQEIADTVGVSARLVATWRQRGSHGLPRPDAQLASGAVWFADTIEPWIARLRHERGSQGPDEAERLVRALARRTFRLARVLWEEPPLRAGAIDFHARRLGELSQPLGALLEGGTRQLGAALFKTLYAIPTELAHVVEWVDVVPHDVRSSQGRVAVPPDVEERLLAMRPALAAQLLPRVVDAVRHLERVPASERAIRESLMAAPPPPSGRGRRPRGRTPPPDPE